MALSAFEPVGRQDMAGLLGISLRTFAELEGKAVVTPIHRGRGGQATTYDVRATIRQYLAYRAKETPRDRLFRLQADKVEQEVKARAGDLLEAAQVESEWASIATTVKRAMLALPGRLLQLGIITVTQLGPTTEECHSVIRHLGKAGS